MTIKASSTLTEVKVNTDMDPVSIKDEDHAVLLDIQTKVDSLSKHRQEMGRLLQLLGNLREEANNVEVSLSSSRKSLADKYELDKKGSGQWALDFEKKEFVKTSPGSPVIP